MPGSWPVGDPGIRRAAAARGVDALDRRAARRRPAAPRGEAPLARRRDVRNPPAHRRRGCESARVRIVATRPTPFGALTVVVDERGRVVASGFGPLGELLAPYDGPPPRPGPLPDTVLGPIERYLSGERDALADVPLAMPGGGFQRDAWIALHAVPAGGTISYAELATRAGSPAAARAAGTACARNPLAPFVPCHRVVRADGSLGGYGFGLEVKRRLLSHEGASTD